MYRTLVASTVGTPYLRCGSYGAIPALVRERLWRALDFLLFKQTCHGSQHPAGRAPTCLTANRLPAMSADYSCTMLTSNPLIPQILDSEDPIYGQLVVLKKNGDEGGKCQMTNDVLNIGRDPEKCDIQIRLPEVSKVQACLKAINGKVWVENLSQTNPGGTLLNDNVVMQPRPLAEKDVITICGRRFRFDYGACPACARPTQSPATERASERCFS